MVEQGAAHPTSEDLLAFAHGNLLADRLEQVESHVEACDSCCEFLKSVPNDAFLDKLRNHQAGDTIVAAPDMDTNAHEKSAVDNAEVPVELGEHARYRVIRTLGAGGMGVVYEAEHRLMERSVALKVINRKLFANPAAVDRFHTEVKAAAKLSHRNIVAAFDAEQAGDVHFLVMEYVDGVSLAELVKRHGALPIKHASNYVMQAALGLQHAFEQGMVHRDIKPQNLMRTKEGRVKILDFGLARLASVYEEGQASQGLTDEGVTLGTPDFIAPEQARDSRAADVRSDIYSLGCTLYYLLTARPPYPRGTAVEKILAHCEKTPEPVSKFRNDAPAALLAVLDRMIEKDPEQRFQTPEEIIDALRPFGSSTPASNAETNRDAASQIATTPTAAAPIAATQLDAPRSPTADENAPGKAALGATAPNLAVPLNPTQAADSLDWMNDEPQTATALSPLQGKAKKDPTAGLLDPTTLRFAALGGGAVLALGLLFTLSSLFSSSANDVNGGVAVKNTGKNDSPTKPNSKSQFNGSAAIDANANHGGSGGRPGSGRPNSGRQARTTPPTGGTSVLLVVPYRGYWYGDYQPVRRVLESAGMRVVIGSSQAGGMARSHEMDSTKGQHEVKVDIAMADASPDAFDAVVFVGGATEEFTGALGETTYSFINEMAADNKLVASLCKGNEILARAGLLRGREAALSEYIPDDVKRRSGARWTSEKPYVESDNVITGRHYRDAEVFAKAMAQRL